MASAVGSVSVVINVQPTITGLSASANLHQVTVIGDAIVPPTGFRSYGKCRYSDTKNNGRYTLLHR